MMVGKKPWYKSQTILVSLVSMLLAIAAFVANLLGIDAVAAQSVVTAILGALGIRGRIKATQTIADDDDDTGSPPSPTIAMFAMMVLLLGACSPYTYSGRTSATTIEGHGTAGTHVTVTVDGAGVCQVTGEASTLEVDAATAVRICAAYPGKCTWTADQ